MLPRVASGYHPNKPSAPVYGVGTGDRSGTTHMPRPGKGSPGPIYMMRASVGKQVSSSKRSSPMAAFSKANRFPPDKK